MKFPVKFVIAVCLVVAGIVGMVVCLTPHYGVEKVVCRYLDAAKDGDAEAMLEETAVSQLAGLFGGGMGALVADTSREEVIRETFGIPGNAKLESADILGCTVEESSSYYGSGYRVTALIQLEYTEAEGEEQTRIIERSFSVTEVPGEGYKIVG